MNSNLFNPFIANGLPTEMLKRHEWELQQLLLQQQQLLARQQHEQLLHQHELRRQSLLRQVELQQEIGRQQSHEMPQVIQQTQQNQWREGRASPRRNPTEPISRNAQGELMDFYAWKDRPTTLMVRGLGRNFTQREFLNLLDVPPFVGVFDFVYVPWDNLHDVNTRGIGFVKFLEPEYALLFHKLMDGREVDRKKIHVHPARLQGYEANYNHFEGSKIGKHETRRPFFFPGGMSDS